VILAWLGLIVAGMYEILNDTLASVLPADVWDDFLALASPLAFLFPPTFAATVPLALTAFAAIGAVRFLLGIISSKV